MGKKNDTAKPVSAAVDPPAMINSASPVSETVPKATGKAPAKKKKPAAKKKKAPAAKPVVFSNEEIALKAYFISEHRHRHGLHGNEHTDWIEAERQLQAEHRKKLQKKPARKKPARKKTA